MDIIILEIVKTYLGIDVDENGFDVELLVLINAAFSTLKQLGLVSDIVVVEDTIMPNFGDEELSSMVSSYICVKTKTIFDPSASPTIKAAFDGYVSEMESRIEMLCSLNTEVVYE